MSPELGTRVSHKGVLSNIASLYVRHYISDLYPCLSPPFVFFSPLTFCSCDTRIRNGWYGCHRGPEVLQLYHCLNFYPLLCCAKKKKHFFLSLCRRNLQSLPVWVTPLIPNGRLWLSLVTGSVATVSLSEFIFFSTPPRV